MAEAAHEPERPGLPFRASYAVTEGFWSRRLHAEPASSSRSAFQRDRDRIIHSTAFRRLKHKTQVFVAHEGDHFRTRLTHSLEVAQIARSAARSLGLDEDLTEALALAHDFGHTPFGHAGEGALDRMMAPYGGFDHNAQTIRILTLLEHRYAEFDGLNLTVATLDGLIKHNGPVSGRSLMPWVEDLISALGVEPGYYPCLEAQIAALSDDIAYNNHDIDDGLRAGLFTTEGLLELPLVGDAFRAVLVRYPQLEQRRLVHEALRRIISAMIEDLIAETRRRILAHKPRSADDVAACGNALAGFSATMAKNDHALKEFLHARMYRHPRIADRMTAMTDVVAFLFARYIDAPALLPSETRALCEGPRSQRTARVIADFIAGMTDNFALEEHARLAKR